MIVIPEIVDTKNIRDCTFMGPKDLWESCQAAATSVIGVSGGFVAGYIGGVIGGPFGIFVGVLIEASTSCLVGVTTQAIYNCYNTDGEIGFSIG